jgi:hypothetical protein
MRMEAGHGVGIGIYATALWLLGRSCSLADLAAPENDVGALEQDVRAAVALGKARTKKTETKATKRSK